jgi:cysteine desulfurase
MRRIYADNAATTKTDPRVVEEMNPYFSEIYGNPGSMHEMGIDSHEAVEDARRRIADILHCRPCEIIFTGTGTESDNLAILGYVRKNKHLGKHIITTKIEHHAVENPFKQLEKEGFEATYLDVDPDGIIDLEELKKAIREDTFFISIIYANNEAGMVQDIPALARIAKEHGIIFHTDACQATSYLPMDVSELGVDLMTINGSKIYGPKGIGVLFKRKELKLEPIVYGGGHEMNLRSGTENVPLIMGFAKALELVTEEKDSETKRIKELRDKLIEGLLKVPDSRLNGHPTRRLPNNANISFINVEGESLLLLMNEEGIYASTGSACSSKSLDPSHVLLAMGIPAGVSHSSIRFSLGKDTTQEDIDYITEKVPQIVKKLRDMSPLHKKMDEYMNEKGDDNERS